MHKRQTYGRSGGMVGVERKLGAEYIILCAKTVFTYSTEHFMEVTAAHPILYPLMELSAEYGAANYTNQARSPSLF